MKNRFELIKEAEFDVVGFGTNAVDYLIRVPTYPAFNSKVELIDHSQEPGGEIASTLVGLSRLGKKTAYIGRFGDDDAGRLGTTSLINEGVDISVSETIQGASTQIAYIIIDQENGERTVIWHRDAKLAYTKSDAPIDEARRGRILHITPHDTLACIEMARVAKDAGVIVSIDADNLFSGIKELLTLVDICIVSSDLPKKLYGTDDPETGLKKLADETGCMVAGMTLGEQGSVFYFDGTFVRTPCFDVPGGCADTTGAGDAFRTGFLYGILNGSTISDCARYGNAVAALKCRMVGARTSLPNSKELGNLLKNV